jgi:hypothetical protein
MPYRMTTNSRRIWYLALAIVLSVIALGAAAAVPGTGDPAPLAVGALVLIWPITLSIRGVRSATLVATTGQVTVRKIGKNWSAAWPAISTFLAETRPPAPGRFSSGKARRILGVRTRDGMLLWFAELSCDAGPGGPTRIDDSVMRLNEFLALQSPGHSGLF